MKTNIERACTTISGGKESVFEVYYKSGLIRVFRTGQTPGTVKRFIENSYQYNSILPHERIYKLNHD